MLQTKELRFACSPVVSFNFPDIHCAAGETLLITSASGKGRQRSCICWPAFLHHRMIMKSAIRNVIKPLFLLQFLLCNRN
ncbi:hypothetical protein [Agriterribacter sp.]|uniref:hypothetical protein n=1 Tax=Agriterribacter sp. TaxID=2821509 RepID=UPI002C88E802|nr:hypothetical protein [Agriterribacter sp.]HRP55445.1 hypothetical protein [Agriterribacter sp.]